MPTMLRIAPGTVVLNQDPDNPMSGEVVEVPLGEQTYDEFLWVRWATAYSVKSRPRTSS